MPAPYRVAIIGRTGKGDYGHSLDIAWLGVPNTQIVAVADPDEKGRPEAAKRVNALKTYADYREMLEKERPQFVSVAARWADCHRDMVLACAEYGSHILLEKPMARTLAEADEMVAACEAKHVKMALAHRTRYSPRLAHAKQLIADGRLGDILEMRGRGKEDHRGGGEDLIVLGTHIMDLMRFLAGDARWCSARVFDKGVPVTREHVREGAEGLGLLAGDELHAMYGFKNPTTGYFGSHRARAGAGARFGLSVYGTKGILTLGTESFPPVYFIEDPTWAPGQSKAKWVEITGGGVGQPETAKDLHPLQANTVIAEDLVHAVETDTQPRGSMYDGRAALEMILAVYESHRLNTPVPLPLKNREHPLKLL